MKCLSAGQTASETPPPPTPYTFWQQNWRSGVFSLCLFCNFLFLKLTICRSDHMGACKVMNGDRILTSFFLVSAFPDCNIISTCSSIMSHLSLWWQAEDPHLQAWPFRKAIKTLDEFGLWTNKRPVFTLKRGHSLLSEMWNSMSVLLICRSADFFKLKAKKDEWRFVHFD